MSVTGELLENPATTNLPRSSYVYVEESIQCRASVIHQSQKEKRYASEMRNQLLAHVNAPVGMGLWVWPISREGLSCGFGQQFSGYKLAQPKHEKDTLDRQVSAQQQLSSSSTCTSQW